MVVVVVVCATHIDAINSREHLEVVVVYLGDIMVVVPDRADFPYNIVTVPYSQHDLTAFLIMLLPDVMR